MWLLRRSNWTLPPIGWSHVVTVAAQLASDVTSGPRASLKTRGTPGHTSSCAAGSATLASAICAALPVVVVHLLAVGVLKLACLLVVGRIVDLVFGQSNPEHTLVEIY